MNSVTAEKVRPEYDSIGDLFKKYEGTPSQYAQIRTVLDLVGDVTGKSVLDLACV